MESKNTILIFLILGLWFFVIRERSGTRNIIGSGVGQSGGGSGGGAGAGRSF